MKNKKRVLSIFIFLLCIIFLPACENEKNESVQTLQNKSYVKTESEEISDITKTLKADRESVQSEEVIENVSYGNQSYFEVHYLDVGQADATLVQCNGKNMLIDGGNVEDSSLIYAYLKEHEVEYLDYIICTHAHEDHVGGLAGALNYAEAGIVYCPVQWYDSDAFQNFIKYLKKQNKEIKIPEVNTEFYLGDARCLILGVNSIENNVNNTSIVLKIDYGETSFLFSGDNEQDAEKMILDSGTDIKCNVIKVPHHGSDTSLSYRWLDSTEAEYGIISVGKDNTYGHPSENTMSKLRDADVKVYRTDMQGHIVCVSDGKELEFNVERNENVDTFVNLDGMDSVDRSNSNEEKMIYAGSYVLNTNTKKFHYLSCSSVKQMKEKNKQITDLNREEIMKQGYSPCGNCNP